MFLLSIKPLSIQPFSCRTILRHKELKSLVKVLVKIFINISFIIKKVLINQEIKSSILVASKAEAYFGILYYPDSSNRTHM